MRFLIGFALLALVSGCAAPPPPAKAPAPPPVQPAPPPVADWRDTPLTPGGWRYAAAEAAATFADPSGKALFVMRCDIASRTVILSQTGGVAASPLTMSVTTSYGATNLPAQASAGEVQVRLGARDPFLDRMAFSRGRISVHSSGMAQLILPAWAEIGRVIEDCRA